MLWTFARLEEAFHMFIECSKRPIESVMIPFGEWTKYLETNPMDASDVARMLRHRRQGAVQQLCGQKRYAVPRCASFPVGGGE